MSDPRGGREGARRRAAEAIAVYVLAAALLATIQLATPHPIDRDGYFHARYANLLPARGLDRTFVWAQESALRDRFSDKELLFHALLTPFCAREGAMVPGAKAAALLLGAGVVLALHLVLRAGGVRWPAFFALLLFAAGNHVLFRLSMARPHLLAVILAIAGAHAIVARRHAAAAAIGFVFAWSYAAPHLLVGLAVADLLARRLRDGTWEARPLAASSAGVAAGLVLHPYFPNDLHAFWIQSVLVLKQAWGGEAPLRLGAEFDPVTTRSLLLTSTGALAALLGGVAAGLAGRERPSARTVSLGAMAAATLLLFLLSAKFVEYFAPFAILFAASAASDQAGERRLRDHLGVAAAVVAVALGLGWRSISLARRAAAATPPPALEGAARFLRRDLPAGETVAHLGWSEFAVLFHFDPDHRYLVSFDPLFMWARDPERARLLEDVRAGRRPIDAEELRTTFGARRLVVSKERPRQVAAALEAGLEVVYEDEGGVVFALD